MTQEYIDAITRAARNAYQRKRRASNPERTKAEAKLYWTRKAIRELAQAQGTQPDEAKHE